MRQVEVLSGTSAGSVWLHIPDAWDGFIFRGYLYARIGDTVRCVEQLPTNDERDERGQISDGVLLSRE